MKPFTVLLGGDGVGKSTACSRLRDEYGLTVLELESLAHESRYDYLGVAQRALFEKVLSGDYALTLKVACLHVGVATLHDAVTRARSAHEVVVDGYYYKVLSKVACFGLDDVHLGAAWRALPPPSRVVYLRLDPELAFERIANVRRLDPLEHHDGSPSRDAFVTLQRAMNERMLAEVDGLDVRFVDANRAPGEVARSIHDAIRGEA